MRGMRKLFAIALLIIVAGLGTPAAFADGNAESPGVTVTQSTTVDGSAESPGITGNAESPGFVLTVVIILNAIIK